MTKGKKTHLIYNIGVAKVHLIYIGALLGALIMLAACSRSTLGRLVGSDRDEHGCIASAGYMWSDALHDCVRVWEAGERFDDGGDAVFLIFSLDSLYAEIFPSGKEAVLCRRVKGKDEWRAIEGKERVWINNGITTIKGRSHTYTKRALD